MSFRPTTASDGTTVQGGLTVAKGDYRDMHLNKLVLGVILDVYPSDNDMARSSQQTMDRHGYTHECTVLVVNDGSSAYMVLENVIITPDAPSGLDDYSERLPRGSSTQVDGEALDSSMQHIDPYDLDGDWCVVGFLGGRIEGPFIVRWWPHARNVYDPATSGEGSDGKALVQHRRSFRRVNGTETVITSKGNIIVSTTFANSSLAPGSDPKLGRFARNLNDDEGGSVRVNIKPSQFVELTFNPQEEGIGVVDDPDEELPQQNPPQTGPQASGDRPETYIYVDRDQIDFYIPDTFNAIIGTDINVTVENDINTEVGNDITATVDNDVTIDIGNNVTVTAGSTAELEAVLIKLGAGAGADPVVLGEALRTWFNGPFTVLSPFGPLSINPASTATPVFDAHLSTKSVVE